MYLRSLAIDEKALGAEHISIATGTNNLALLYFDQGRYEKAETMYLRALAIYEKAFGVDNLNTAITINNLALLYDAQGSTTKQNPHIVAPSQFEKSISKEHRDTAQSLIT